MTKVATVHLAFKDIDAEPGRDPAPGVKVQLFLAGSPTGAPVDVAEGAASVDLTIDIPGKYHVEVSKFDTAGVIFGSPTVSDEFVVPETVSVPATVTVALA